MDAKFASAAAAYANAARGIKAPGTEGGDRAGASGAFADMVSDVIGQSVKAGQASERAAMQAVSGTASLQDVVTSVATAETSLQTVVAIRDRVIGAYQEIMRMPI
ncbi:flagellar hook-basal body complex protein FliE [Tistrella mobilis]